MYICIPKGQLSCSAFDIFLSKINFFVIIYCTSILRPLVCQTNTSNDIGKFSAKTNYSDSSITALI
jgi:hypothetical protein